MHYPTLAICRQHLFPYIRQRMTKQEPAPQYEIEIHGLEKLESIFVLMQRDDYPDIFAKSAYLFCSIIDGHHFSNGNKRLGVALLNYFLLANGKSIRIGSVSFVRKTLESQFPNLQWEEVASFKHPHEYFFYHLALIIADRTQKGPVSFSEEQLLVHKLLTKVVTA